MYNSSLQIDNSTSIFNEALNCQGHFGIFFIFVVTTLFFIVGTPIHCWSLWLFLHGNIKPKLVFPLNITILELFCCFLCIVNLIINSYFSLKAYKLSLFLIGLCWTFRPLLQIFMCVEHYLAVIHPVIFLRYKGIQYRIALVAVAWLIGMGTGLRLLFIKVPFFPDDVMFFVFCIAVMIISFCCVSVLCALKRPGPGDRRNVETVEKDKHNKTERGRGIENKQKKKAFKIIFYILVSILICYLPLVIAYFMGISKIDQHLYLCDISPLILSIALIVVFISALFRMYNDHLKHRVCFSKLLELVKGQ